ncbi:hypothetical protein Sros_3009 [Streptosporangium roseum DSM 43021]|uniref:Uncharacterized protein n=1 Tax=Streptosporangium roseum (strain ATCC 12428 / DSM 43021 / JCM 3005 / KCTC 9067 / NCIMB 10171 / NRRL 2505 / NI 9100) TaxID=479432 RepID=D2B9U8_STRRD|nr:hypothetical protein Sros_3009 [Streptosporangium roseum DSM 43021]
MAGTDVSCNHALTDIGLPSISVLDIRWPDLLCSSRLTDESKDMACGIGICPDGARTGRGP